MEILKLGTAVQNLDIDEETLLFTVTEIRSGKYHFPDLSQHDLPFMEYLLEAHFVYDESIVRRLRVLSDTEIAELRKIDEFGYDQDFEKVVNDPVFFVEDERGKTEYHRIQDVQKPYHLNIRRETAHTGETISLKLWDFWRDMTIEGGVHRTELLLVEMDTQTGWFQLWQGPVLNPSQLVYL